MERIVFGFDPEKRTATLYNNGAGKFDSINITSLGAIVSGILTRPDEFQNRCAFVSELISAKMISLKLYSRQQRLLRKTGQLHIAQWMM